MNRIAIYLRLSEEDYDKADESVSIVNQRDYIRNYIVNEKSLIDYEIKEYVDESISDDLYFSAWITNDDISIYERYLKGSKTANTIKEGSDLAVGIYSTAS